MKTPNHTAPLQRQYLALALEPRMMFDGAAVATAADAADQADNGAEANDPNAGADASADNQAPVITGPSTQLNPNEEIGSDASAQLEGTKALSLTQNGKTLIAISDAEVWDSSNFEYRYESAVHLFQVNDDGSLTLEQSLEQGDNDALSGASAMQLSDDGNTLYVLSDSGISVYERASSDSEFAFVETAAQSIATDNGYIASMALQGDQLFVSAGNNLYLFSHDENGLSLTQTIQGDDQTPLNSATQLVVSDDLLFVATNGADSAVSVFDIGTHGTLTFSHAISNDNAPAYTAALTLSTDGHTLYTVNADLDNVSLQTYTLDNSGNATLVGDAIALDGQVSQLQVAEDNSALYVLGDRLTTYEIASDGSLNQVATYSAEDLGSNAWGASLGAFTIDNQQDKIYLGNAASSWNSSILTAQIGTPGPSYTENGDAVRLFVNGQLSDFEADQTDNYNGFTLLVERDGSGAEADLYGFADTAALSLNNGQIFNNGDAIATFSQSSAGVLTLSFTANTTQQTAQQVLRQITYSNTSDDPTPNGTSPNIKITVTDTEGASSDVVLPVSITAVNDPAIVSTQPLNPSYEAGSERINVFSATQIDTVEQDQQVWQLNVTIDAIDSNDVLHIGEDEFVLGSSTNGPTSSINGNQYIISVDESTQTTTLTLYLMRSPADTAALVDSIAYENLSGEASGSRTLQLGVVEYDGNGGTETWSDSSSTITLTEASSPNTAPEISTNDSSIHFTESDEPVALFPTIQVNDQQLDSFNDAAGNYDRSVLNVRLNDATSDESLGWKDSDQFTLSDNRLYKEGVQIGSVNQSADAISITFTDSYGATPTTADIQAVLAQITYSNTSDLPAASAAVSVTLTDQLGLTSEALNVSVDIESVNDAPTLETDPLITLGELQLGSTLDNLEQLDGLIDTVSTQEGQLLALTNSGLLRFSSDDSGQLTYEGTTELSILADEGREQENLSDYVREMVSSRDGQDLYFLVDNGNKILHYSLSDSGEATRVEQLVSDYDVDGATLYSMEHLTLSSDGKHLYANAMTNLIILNRDPDNGTISYHSTLQGDSWTAPYYWGASTITAEGEYVFLTSQNSLHIYQMSDDGGDSQFSFVTALQNGGSNNGALAAISNANAILFESTLGDLYLQNANSITRLNFDTETHTLRYLGVQLSAADNDIDGVMLTDSGKGLVVQRTDGTTALYSTADDQLALSQSLSSQSGDLVKLSESAYALINSESAISLTREATSVPSYLSGHDAVNLTATLRLNDAELTLLDNYGGATLSLNGDSNDQFGIAPDSGFVLDGTSLTENGNRIAEVSATENGLTLTFVDGVTKENATAILHSLVWSNSSTTSYSHDISVTLSDEQGASQTWTHASEVIQNSAPQPTDQLLADLSSRVNDPFSYTLPDNLFSDADNDPLTLSVSNLPDGLTYDPQTRTLSGTLTSLGSYTLVITASDGDLSSQRELNLEVIDNFAPIATDTLIEPNPARAEQSYSYTLADNLFTDADGDTLTLSVSGLPDGLSFNPDNQTISGTPSNAGEYEITLTASDGISQSDRTFTFTVNEANHAPVTNSEWTPAAGRAGTAYSTVLPADLFSDPDNDALSISIANLPTGLSFDSTTGVISGTPVSSGSFDIRITATDSLGATATLTQQLTIQAYAPNDHIATADQPAPVFESNTTGTQPAAFLTGTESLFNPQFSLGLSSGFSAGFSATAAADTGNMSLSLDVSRREGTTAFGQFNRDMNLSTDSLPRMPDDLSLSAMFEHELETGFTHAPAPLNGDPVEGQFINSQEMNSQFINSQAIQNDRPNRTQSHAENGAKDTRAQVQSAHAPTQANAARSAAQNETHMPLEALRAQLNSENVISTAELKLAQQSAQVSAPDVTNADISAAEITPRNFDDQLSVAAAQNSLRAQADALIAALSGTGVNHAPDSTTPTDSSSI